MSGIVEKWKAFCEWQRRPSHIPQMTEEHHRCCTCGQEYQGSYCPCCGQSARIGRYSFKNDELLIVRTRANIHNWMVFIVLVFISLLICNI